MRPTSPATDRQSASRADDPPRRHLGLFEGLARRLTELTGTTGAFLIAVAIVIVWAGTGWLFDYGDTWQLVINTGTTIVTFLMVFLIQRAQNKDSLALHLKLNELIAATRGASNRLIALEDVGEDELRALHRHYALLAELARHERSLLESHSIDEARGRHDDKRAGRPIRNGAPRADRRQA
ncbi:MAG: low affinity iron permease family protein [Sandaracinus sp.]